MRTHLLLATISSLVMCACANPTTNAPPPSTSPTNPKATTIALRVEKAKAENLGFTFSRMRDYFTALNSAKSWYTGDVFMIELPASSNSFRHVRELNLTTDQGRMVKATDLCTIQEKGK